MRTRIRRHGVYIGIDNGITGTIGIISRSSATLYHTPIKKEQDYTKKRQNISRIESVELVNILQNFSNSFVVLERPMINPGRWKASMSAIRCLEATLTVIDELKIPYQYCNSKEWQKILLPKHSKDADLKQMSLEIGKRLFPTLNWSGFKDADGLLIAEWARRMKL